MNESKLCSVCGGAASYSMRAIVQGKQATLSFCTQHLDFFDDAATHNTTLAVRDSNLIGYVLETLTGPPLRAFLGRAQKWALELGHSRLSPEHCLLSIINDELSSACRVLFFLGMGLAQLEEMHQQILEALGKAELFGAAGADAGDRMERLVGDALNYAIRIRARGVDAPHALAAIAESPDGAAARILGDYVDTRALVKAVGLVERAERRMVRDIYRALHKGSRTSIGPGGLTLWAYRRMEEWLDNAWLRVFSQERSSVYGNDMANWDSPEAWRGECFGRKDRFADCAVLRILRPAESRVRTLFASLSVEADAYVGRLEELLRECQRKGRQDVVTASVPSYKIARSLGSRKLHAEHYFLAIAQDDQSFTAQCCSEYGIDYGEALLAARRCFRYA